MSTLDTTRVRTERLAQLRAAMARHGIDAVVVPSADPHLSEYLPGRWKGREWLSGFTGSVGTFIATAGFAGVWTDGRYWTQAEQELAGSTIELMKIPSGASLLHIDWLAAHLAPGQTVAVDARVLGLSVARLLAEALAVRGIKLRTDIDLLDEVWTDRPARDGHAYGQAGRHPRRHGQAGRRPPLHLDPGRHRLAVQPARRRCQLQPGVPGARAGRAGARDPVRRRRQGAGQPVRAPAGG
jgi:Xaa-Pro aminopeptidase